MMHTKTFLKTLHFIIFAILISFICIPYTEAASEKNSLTFINQSGDYALVKLVGPSRRIVEVPNGSSRTVKIAGGTYMIYVRYGNSQSRYRYTKGESFQIEESAFSYTEASLTLHGVINGNYSTEGSSEYEFNRQ